MAYILFKLESQLSIAMPWKLAFKSKKLVVLALCQFSCTGMKEINTDKVHATLIMTKAALGVIFLSYLNGLEMAQYLSTLITHKFKMEAVEHMMSNATQMLQNDPKGQNPAISATAFQGMTNTATKRSETAKEITKKLVTLDLRWRNLMTAAQTKVLPRSVERISKERKQPVRIRKQESLFTSNPSPSIVVLFQIIFPSPAKSCHRPSSGFSSSCIYRAYNLIAQNQAGTLRVRLKSLVLGGSLCFLSQKTKTLKKQKNTDNPSQVSKLVDHIRAYPPSPPTLRLCLFF